MEDKTIRPDVVTEDCGVYSIETNIQALVEQVFRVDPAPACSLGLQLESELENNSLEEQSRTVFEILASILVKGLKFKYGDDTDPRRLSANQIAVLKEYMQSFGWNFKIETTSIDIDEEADDYREGRTPKEIEWYRLRLPDPEFKVKHDITFTHYNAPVLSGKVHQV